MSICLPETTPAKHEISSRTITTVETRRALGNVTAIPKINLGLLGGLLHALLLIASALGQFELHKKSKQQKCCQQFLRNIAIGNALEWPSSPCIGLFAQVLSREEHREQSAIFPHHERARFLGVLPPLGHRNRRHNL
jgi:hypothetical protein